MMQKGFFIFAFRDQETIMKVWLLFIFGIVPIISQAQNRMISGEVTDKEYNPIEFVTISLLSANDSSLIAGTITNEKGKFTLSCEEKKDYIVRASHIEYPLCRTFCRKNPLSLTQCSPGSAYFP